MATRLPRWPGRRTSRKARSPWCGPTARCALPCSLGFVRQTGPVFQTPPVAFRRAPLDVNRRIGAPATKLDQPLALGAAPRRFLVKLARLGRRPSLVGERLNAHVPLELAHTDRYEITRLERMSRFRALAVQLHLTGVDRALREAARLEEARRPQPLVQAHL